MAETTKYDVAVLGLWEQVPEHRILSLSGDRNFFRKPM